MNQELLKFKETQKLAYEAALYGERNVKIGMTELELANLIGICLENGMAVIIDVAPCFNGVIADIGYSFSFGENQKVKKAREDLLLIREFLVKKVNQKIPRGEIYRGCTRFLSSMGYDNCHKKYPFGVLGHRLGYFPFESFPKISIVGFQPQAIFLLLKESFNGSPIWDENGTKPLSPGLWAVEPHLGGDDFGVKFEEILVVEKTRSFWLDNDLPHLKPR